MTNHHPQSPHTEHPHMENFSACYDINTKYLGITKDATMAVDLSTTQLQVC